MVSVYTDTPSFFNDICEEIRLFLPEEKHIEQLSAPKNTGRGVVLHHFWKKEGAEWRNRAEYYVDGILAAHVSERHTPAEEFGRERNRKEAPLLVKRMKKHAVKRIVYETLRQYYQKDMPWGSLTGIRPTKFLRELSAEHGAAEARRIFAAAYHVSEQKIRLAETICSVQAPFMDRKKENELDIYIGIPFCISRCKYCSFISKDLQFNQTIKTQYLPRLFWEMDSMRPVIENYHVRAVYIGGGTPTALSEKELEALLLKVTSLFRGNYEFTVEAGRPDTITREKLAILKENNVQRISINAQTTNDRTLELIGRRHTTQEFEQAFSLAKEFGFQSVNTDMILGLPGEELTDVEKTLRDIMRYEPDNVTVHTLAIKQSSSFAEEQRNDLPDAKLVSNMVELSQNFLQKKGYLPYYLYRQKYMSGNLENVGFARPGKECVYNIDIMEETVSNLAFGAGAISKRLFPEKNLIKRAPNVKDLKNYIERTDEMVLRKKELF